jgi:hypothetical protein
MSGEPLPQSEIILYQTEDGRTRVQCRSDNETLWLTQALIAELFQKDVRTINEHLVNIFEEGELVADSVIRKFRITAADGKSYSTQHYNLDAILAVGFRVRSHRGTQFRQWAIGRLNEYLVKGFTMDDERLKNPPGKGQKDYFDEQLERIRDIRSWAGPPGRPWPAEHHFARRETPWMLLLPPLVTAVLVIWAGVFADSPFSPLAWVKLNAEREYGP